MIAPASASADDSPQPKSDLRAVLNAAAVPAAICAVMMTLLALSAGASLGLYLGGLGVAAIVTGSLVLAEDTPLGRFSAAGGIIDTIGAAWLIAALASETTLGEWLACYILLAAMVAAIAALAVLLQRLRLHSALAAAITTTVALAWLTWPIWLTAALRGPRGQGIVDWLTPLHPPLAANGVLRHLGIWGEQSIMYRLTIIGQDIPYALPESVVPAVALHVVLAAGLLLAGRVRG